METSHQRHAAQMYAETLCQIYESQLYNLKGRSRWIPRGLPRLQYVLISQAFVFHARHTTFYMLYAKILTKYLTDIATYGAEYKTRVPNPIKLSFNSQSLIVSGGQKIRPHSSNYSRMCSTTFSAEVGVGVLAAKSWNRYYRY